MALTVPSVLGTLDYYERERRLESEKKEAAGKKAEAERAAFEAEGLKKEQAAKTEADKVVAEKEAADIKAKTTAAALRKRRRATYPYKTAGMEAGLLSGAPVLLKALLGQ